MGCISIREFKGSSCPIPLASYLSHVSSTIVLTWNIGAFNYYHKSSLIVCEC